MLLGLLGIFVIYLLFVALPYVPHKKVSAETKKNFRAADCYADTVGTERVAPVFTHEGSMEMHLRMLNEAKKKIIVSTYKILSDEAGRDYMAALIEAADRGVKVEILVNGINEMFYLKSNPYMQALAGHKNVAAYVYNPISLLRPWKIQASLHSKYTIVDDKCFILGGRNIFNLFMGDYGKKHNKDSELLVYETGGVTGNSYRQLLQLHQQMMKLSDVKPYKVKKEDGQVKKAAAELREREQYLRKQYPAVYRPYDWAAETVPANKVSLLSTPLEAENKEPTLWYYLMELAKSGKKVSIYTPYIIAGPEMYEDLTALAKQTDSVDIITNAVENGANPFGCSDYMNQHKKIWATGVKVHEFSSPNSLHMKAFCIDDRMSVIGSFNMDMRSAYIDTELMLAVDSKELNQLLKADFDQTLTYCRTVQDDGTYQYNENYVRKEMRLSKRVIYTIMRGGSVIARRFL